MIEFRQVSLGYDGVDVLKDINLVLNERRIAVVGSNGSGKSSLVRLMNGLRLPTSGSVLVDGLDTKTSGKDVRRKVGFVFQNPDNQIVLPTVEEDLAFGLKNRKLPADVIEAKIVDILARYDLTALREQSVYTLSGGQKQLIAIAGVLAMDPDYIVLDEPMTLLDLKNKHRLAAAIDSFAQVAIVVSHHLDFISHFDRVLVVEDGRIAIDDVPNRALAAYVERMA
jgi:biotin transport system ATP-binding protein